MPGIMVKNKSLIINSSPLRVRVVEIKPQLGIINSFKKSRDFPGGPVVENPGSQCRGPGFDPWLGN